MIGYMIKNTLTGEYFRKKSYSGGGWSMTGDVWTERRNVKNLLENNAFLLGTYEPVDPYVVVMVETKELQTWQPKDFR